MNFQDSKNHRVNSRLSQLPWARTKRVYWEHGAITAVWLFAIAAGIWGLI